MSATKMINAIRDDINNAASCHPELVEGSHEKAGGKDSSTSLGMTKARTCCIPNEALYEITSHESFDRKRDTGRVPAAATPTRRRRHPGAWFSAALLPVALAAGAAAESVWIAGGESRVAVVADAEIIEMNPDARANAARAPLHWAAHDLVDYLEKMTGTRPFLGAEPPEGLVPVRVRLKRDGEDLGATSEFGCAYRIDLRADGVDLVGESYDAAAFAVYHVLEELGVRWYGPAEWAEIVPRLERVALPLGTRAFAPSFHTRRLWGGGISRRWLLRNRIRNVQIPQGHAFHGFMQGMEPRDQPPLVERHPEYYPIVDGRVRGSMANLSHPDVLQRAIDRTRRHFETNPDTLGIAVGPDDGFLIDERPESRALMSGKPDPLSKVQDSTDLMVNFANWIAEALYDDYPDKVLGFYIYANHQMVPTVAPHPMLFPTVAPIHFSRYTSIGAPHSPTAVMLKNIILQWRALVPRLGFYLYNFNLADLAMPFTRTAAFRRDLPNLHRWGLEYAVIESLNNWHTMIPGSYMTAQLMWDVETDVDALLEEFYPLYYGPAADAMRAYDRLLEDAYEYSSAYSGNLWAMHRILTPEVMSGLEEALQRAVEAVGDAEPYATRLAIPRHSMRFARAWFKGYFGMQRFDFPAAGEANREFLANLEEARERFPDFFSRTILSYWNAFHRQAFEQAETIAREGVILLELPDVWRVYLDATLSGESMGLYDPRSPKDTWLQINTYSATLDEQGFPYYRGLIWYALDIDIPAFEVPDGEEVYMWFGGNDNNTRIFIDGRLAGEFPTGNFRPGEAALTPYLRPGTRQHVVVAVDNRAICELGTGGIMRPAVLYRRARREGELPPEPPTDFHPGEGPLFTTE